MTALRKHCQEPWILLTVERWARTRRASGTFSARRCFPCSPAAGATHIAARRCDAAPPEILGMKKIVSQDAIRRAFKAIEETEGAVWLRPRGTAPSHATEFQAFRSPPANVSKRKTPLAPVRDKPAQALRKTALEDKGGVRGLAAEKPQREPPALRTASPAPLRLRGRAWDEAAARGSPLWRPRERSRRRPGSRRRRIRS